MSNLSKIHLSKYQIEDKKYGLTTDTNREIDLAGEIWRGEKGTEGVRDRELLLHSKVVGIVHKFIASTV